MYGVILFCSAYLLKTSDESCLDLGQQKLHSEEGTGQPLYNAAVSFPFLLKFCCEIQLEL